MAWVGSRTSEPSGFAVSLDPVPPFSAGESSLAVTEPATAVLSSGSLFAEDVATAGPARFIFTWSSTLTLGLGFGGTERDTDIFRSDFADLALSIISLSLAELTRLP